MKFHLESTEPLCHNKQILCLITSDKIEEKIHFDERYLQFYKVIHLKASIVVNSINKVEWNMTSQEDKITIEMIKKQIVKANFETDFIYIQLERFMVRFFFLNPIHLHLSSYENN